MDIDELVFTDNIYYKKFTHIPFTGKVTGKTQCSFKNGLMDGNYVEYYDNGSMEKKGRFIKGKKDGIWHYYNENGKLLTEGSFKNDVKHGSWIEYFDDGTDNKYIDENKYKVVATREKEITDEEDIKLNLKDYEWRVDVYLKEQD